MKMNITHFRQLKEIYRHGEVSAQLVRFSVVCTWFKTFLRQNHCENLLHFYFQTKNEFNLFPQEAIDLTCSRTTVHSSKHGRQNIFHKRIVIQQSATFAKKTFLMLLDRFFCIYRYPLNLSFAWFKLKLINKFTMKIGFTVEANTCE